MPSITGLKSAQCDSTLMEEGVWIEIGLGDEQEPLRLLMRSDESNKAQAWESRRTRKQRGYYQNEGGLPLQLAIKNEIDKLAEVLILDWNLTDNGATFPCTPDNIRLVMRENPTTRRDAILACGKRDAFRILEVEALAKNSERPSLVTSDTGAAVA